VSSLPTDVVATVVDVLMPKMGSSVVEGTVVEWNVAAGDAVAADEALCVISTDKVDSECPSPASGVLAEILVEAGETVDVGTVIGRVAVGDGGVAASPSVPQGDTTRRAPAGDGGADGNAGSSSTSVPQGNTTRLAAVQPPTGAHRGAAVNGAAAPATDPRATRREALRRSSPVAAKIASEHGIDVLALSGSGRNGRVTKVDVLREVERLGNAAAPAGSAVEAPAEPPMHIETPYRRDPSVPVEGQERGGTAQPAGAGTSASTSAELFDTRRRAVPDSGPNERDASTDEGTVVPLSRMRTAIGTQMRKALDTAAHATTIVECDMSRIERQRRELGTTALPLVTRHVLDTLRDFPALNATYDGQTLTRFERVHLGVAVSLGDDGLIVPVIHDAQDLAAEGLATRIKDLAGRARTGELTPDEVRGGTFTITNPGAAGALVATPIINVPQVAILDLEAIVKRPVVVTDADGQDSIAIRPMTHLCMSWDHRVLDGMYAARFLTALRGRIEGR
jgi:pyruvate/2-oxoglutarate dehydrogenase complex dihydrolipoamide acyltransferase (E2) component